MADETKLPTEEEIAKLPRWARVAFAARCARRVLPLFEYFWKDAPPGHVSSVSQAVEVAEEAAAGAMAAYSTISGSYSVNATAAARAALAAHAPPAEAAARAAAAAAVAAADATRAAAESGAGTAEDDADTIEAAAAAATHAARAVSSEVIRRDFDAIARLAAEKRWTNDTRVSPLDYGPLWPDGPPSGWPADEPSVTTSPAFDPVSPPAIVVAWDPAVVSPAQYARVVAALNKVVQAHGGAGLKRLESKPFAAAVPAEVPTP